MSKLKAILKPDVAKFITSHYPVVYKRTALWFFSNEMKTKDDQEIKSRKPKLNHTRILNQWRKMDPEAKRKYFNMAEFDELRYLEQKSKWISEVSALLVRHVATIEDIKEVAPSGQQLQESFLASINQLHKKYQFMIQAESTKEIYKSAIKRADYYEHFLSPEDIISTLPAGQRSVLSKPKRPPTSFLLYALDNMNRYTKLNKTLANKPSPFTWASKEWEKLDPKKKQEYEDRYSDLKSEYDTAMEQFRNESSKSPDYLDLERAEKEKSEFRRSLKKRLRVTATLPVCPRNSFNFFVKDNKSIPLVELKELWRDLPEEKKLKYVQMNQEDLRRYQAQRDIYNEITGMLEELIRHTKRRIPLKDEASPTIDNCQEGSDDGGRDKMTA